MPRRPLPPFIARAACALALALFAGASAEAGIASTSGAISVISHPTGTLNSNTLESDTTAYVWFERLVTNPGSQSVNHAGAGTVNSTGSANPATILPSLAESYVVHFDQAGGGNATLSNFVITFDHEIIGVFHTNAGLAGSDGTWAPTGLTYGALTARRYELGGGGTSDRYSISSDLKTLTILNTYTTGAGVDEIRVLVNPEPSTFAFMTLGVTALGALVLRRRRRSAEGTSARDDD